MVYHVELTLLAARDLDYLYQRISAAESPAAAQWFNGLEKAIGSLKRFPRRCPVAIESRKARRPMRQLLYGAKPDAYRVLFEIDEIRKVVRVLTIRHGRMDEFTAPE